MATWHSYVYLLNGKCLCEGSVAISDVTVVMSYLGMSPIQNEEVVIYVVLNNSLLIGHSTDCHSVLCITRKGSAKGLTSLHCPKMYSVWVNGNITVSTNEGKLV